MRMRKVLFGMALAVAMTIGVGSVKADAASYTIYVNRKTNIVNVVSRKTGKVVRAMWCSTGKHYSTIRGTYKTRVKYRWRELFGGVYGQYSIRFQGHYLFHSVPYASRNKARVKVSYYNRLGKQDSAGCVRLAVVDEKWLYDHCSLGTKVVIGESRKLEKPTRPKLKLSTKKTYSWDPTDPDSRNPYRVTLTRKKGSGTKVAYGEEFDITKYVTVKSAFTDQETLLENVTYKGTINTKKPGKYTLRVTVKDPATTLSRTKSFTFTVKKAPEEDEA